MLFCFTNICTKFSPHILDFHFCAECHTLALFLQNADGIQSNKNNLLKSCSILVLKKLVKLTPPCLGHLGWHNTSSVVSICVVLCCPSCARQREWCNGTAKSQTSHYHVRYLSSLLYKWIQ
jgi:hypothetical protein